MILRMTRNYSVRCDLGTCIGLKKLIDHQLQLLKLKMKDCLLKEDIIETMQQWLQKCKIILKGILFLFRLDNVKNVMRLLSISLRAEVFIIQKYIKIMKPKY